MHRLERVRIENFRSCDSLEVRLHECTPLVGYNNAGKSNLLAAIEWVLAPRSLSKSDFCEPSKPVVIEALISGLSKNDVENLADKHWLKIEPLIESERLWIRRTQPTPGAAKKEYSKLEVRSGESEKLDEWRV